MRKRNPGARLTKAEKKQALKECREYDGKENPTKRETIENELNWLYLTSDHNARLRAALKHVADLPQMESLRRDTLDGNDYGIREYISRYSDGQIELLLRYAGDAQDALMWLYGLFSREQADRKRKAKETAPGEKVITFPQ